jgi:hypothetical protein
MEWVLILYIYAGVLAKGDSVALATIPMRSQEVCEIAGKEAEVLTSNSTKSTRYVCVKVK